jgi:hypothetical protein
MTRESVVSWWRANSAVAALLAAQMVDAIVWGATLQSRVDVIEAYGPPQLETLTIRINTLEQQNLAQERGTSPIGVRQHFIGHVHSN